MKKNKQLFLFIIFLICFVLLQTTILKADLEDVIENFESTSENVQTNISTKWDYLGKEWQNILLKNEIIKSIDSFFTKISFLFEVLLAEPYSFSLNFFFVVVLWFIFAINLIKILKGFSMFSSWVSFIIGFGITVAFARTKFFSNVSNFLIYLIFKPELWWTRLIIFILILFILVLLYRANSIIGNLIKKQREEIEKEQEKADRGILRSFADAIIKGFKGK